MTLYGLLDLITPYSGIDRAGLGRLYGFVAIGRPYPPGAVVQCGVVNGGSAVLLWHAVGGDRHLWMFDSFEGLPEPGPEDGGKAHAKWEHKMEAFGSWCKGDAAKAKEVAKLGAVPVRKTHIVKGWFAETLPEAAKRIGPIAMLHLDADWYQSTLDCLTYLYPLLASGGLLMLDDYGYWQGTDKAAEDYGIAYLLNVTPPTGAWMVKP